MKKTLMLLALTTTLSACDYWERRDVGSEQDDRVYRTAMDDYRAGRLDAAISGFEQAIKKDPANASARFQLACLLQDVKHDAAGAYCEYREYLRQHPGDDKVALAKDRLALCEKDLARALAAKYGLAGGVTTVEDVETLTKELKQAKDRAQAAEKSLAEAKQQVQTLTEDRKRLMAMIQSDDDAVAGPSASAAASPQEVKDLLEEREDEIPTSSVLLPEQTAAVVPVPSEKTKPPQAAPARPATYAVEDGDTLYAIAKRFYGNIAAWKAIRDANKALISTDGRVRAGDVLTLPNWP